MSPTDATAEFATDDSLLELYLNDHLAGATAGLARVSTMVEGYTDLPIHADLVRLAEELDEERARLQGLIQELGLTPSLLRQSIAKVGEQVGRLKLNGYLFSRSPMSPVLELELLSGAVEGKGGMWRVLTRIWELRGQDPAEWVALAEQADDQNTRIKAMHATLIDHTVAGG